jgi:hypothetical protein
MSYIKKFWSFLRESVAMAQPEVSTKPQAPIKPQEPAKAVKPSGREISKQSIYYANPINEKEALEAVVSEYKKNLK